MAKQKPRSHPFVGRNTLGVPLDFKHKEPKGVWEPLPGSHPKPVRDHLPGECKWPVGDPAPWCCLPVCGEGEPYCEEHKARSLKNLAARNAA